MSKEIREMIDKVKNFKNILNENLTTAYRCIDGEYNKKHDKIEFLSTNLDYSKPFGENCYKITLDTNNAKILNLQKYNELYTQKTGKNGNRFNRHQGLFVIGSMAIDSNYNEELKLFSSALGEELKNKFLDELKNSDAIYGEDAGYVDEFVFAVKNKNIIVNIEKIP